MRKICLVAALLMSVQFTLAQRKTVIVETPQKQVQDDGMILKRKVAIGRFSNETQYAKGIFYDKENDPMCSFLILVDYLLVLSLDKVDSVKH